MVVSLERMAVAFAIAMSLSGPSGGQEARVLYTAKDAIIDAVPTLSGVTVDVFWCQGDSNDSVREQAAAEVAASIAAYGRIQEPNLLVLGVGSFVRSVRLRPVDVDSSDRTEVLGGGDTIAVDRLAESTQRLAQDLAKVSGREFQTVEATTATPSYLRFELCDDPPLSAVSAAVYFQVASDEQVSTARRAIEEIRTKYPMAKVASGIEVTGEISPNQTQVRYYSEGQRPFVETLVEAMSASLNTNVADVYLPKLSSPETQNVIEVWIGKAYTPIETSTFTVCQGEYRERCAPGFEWIPCGVPLEVWATQTHSCGSPVVRKLSSVGGNQCGYDVLEFTCTR